MKEALLILIGVVIGASIMIAPFSKQIIAYIRPTIEGQDGKASMKRLTISLFVLLFTIAFFADLALDLTVSEAILDLITITIIGGIGLTSGHTIAAEYINRKKQTQAPAEEGQVPQHNNER